MKSWDEFENQDVANLLSGISYTINKLKEKLNKEDFKLLEKAKKELENHISRNMSALSIIMACGGNYDSMEDEAKLKTLDLLIELMKTRIEYREKLKEQQESNKNKEDILKIFGL